MLRSALPALLGLLLATACERSPAPPPPTEAPAQEGEVVATTPDGEDGEDPIAAMQELVARARGLSCEAAERCCEAYRLAMGDRLQETEAESCAAVRAPEATQLTCEGAMEGWRRALVAAGLEVPADCPHRVADDEGAEE
jgi:hypothetical protein